MARSKCAARLQTVFTIQATLRPDTPNIPLTNIGNVACKNYSRITRKLNSSPSWRRFFLQMKIRRMKYLTNCWRSLSVSLSIHPDQTLFTIQKVKRSVRRRGLLEQSSNGEKPTACPVSNQSTQPAHLKHRSHLAKWIFRKSRTY